MRPSRRPREAPSGPDDLDRDGRGTLYLARIRANADRLHQHITDVLEYSRVGGLGAAGGTVDVQQLVDDIRTGLHGRLPGAAQRDPDGTRVGLATVKRAIGRLGGEVWIDSDPRKRAGTTFWFTLPPRFGVASSPAAHAVAARHGATSAMVAHAGMA